MPFFQKLTVSLRNRHTDHNNRRLKKKKSLLLEICRSMNRALGERTEKGPTHSVCGGPFELNGKE